MDKEKLFESVRAKLMMVVSAVFVVLGALNGLFPELNVIHVDQEVLNMVVTGISWVVAAFIIGRSMRNTKTS